jgi:tRNA G26 N,N-dimethylase Trm1
MENETHKIELRQERRILKLLRLIREEAEAPPLYYVTDKVCGGLNLSVPPLMRVIEEVRRQGFQAFATHFNSRGVKTDAPAEEVKRILIQLQRKSNPCRISDEAESNRAKRVFTES